MSEQVEDFLAHYGVRGMKWGSRKSKDEINSKDRTIKAKTTIQNISSRQLKGTDRHLYAAYTTYDKNAYGDLMGNFMYNQRGYKNEFVLKKDIKVPSDRKLADTFIKFAKDNPDQVAKDMSKAYNDQHIFGSKSTKHYAKKIANLDPDKIEKGEKLTKEFISSMVSSKSAKSRADFFGSLTKQGYDGMSDVNDRDGIMQDPLIIFSPKKSLGPVKSVKLTRDDLDRYDKMVSFDKAHSQIRADLSEIQR